VTSPTTAPSSVTPFAAVEPSVASRTGQVTAAVFDANTGETWQLNPGITEDTASIVKLQIMGTALQEAQAADSGVPESQSMLMPPMIEQSDNQAATALLAAVGGTTALSQFDRAAGMTSTTPSNLSLIPGTDLPGWGLTTTTALDEVMLVSKYAFPNDLLNDQSRLYGLSLMENVETDQRWGVTSGAPTGTSVALKNGWLPLQADTNWQVNSVGWISGQGRNYVLAVLTDGSPTELDGIATIQTIAAAVYTALGPGGVSRAATP
jgi:Beta-lactamase enzyme family